MTLDRVNVEELGDPMLLRLNPANTGNRSGVVDIFPDAGLGFVLQRVQGAVHLVLAFALSPLALPVGLRFWLEGTDALEFFVCRVG